MKTLTTGLTLCEYINYNNRCPICREEISWDINAWKTSTTHGSNSLILSYLSRDKSDLIIDLNTNIISYSLSEDLYSSAARPSLTSYSFNRTCLYCYKYDYFALNIDLIDLKSGQKFPELNITQEMIYWEHLIFKNIYGLSEPHTFLSPDGGATYVHTSYLKMGPFFDLDEFNKRIKKYMVMI